MQSEKCQAAMIKSEFCFKAFISNQEKRVQQIQKCLSEPRILRWVIKEKLILSKRRPKSKNYVHIKGLYRGCLYAVKANSQTCEENTLPFWISRNENRNVWRRELLVLYQTIWNMIRRKALASVSLSMENVLTSWIPLLPHSICTEDASRTHSVRITLVIKIFNSDRFFPIVSALWNKSPEMMLVLQQSETFQVNCYALATHIFIIYNFYLPQRTSFSTCLKLIVLSF